MAGRLELDVQFNATRRGRPTPSDGSLRLLLIGDFSGRQGRVAIEPGAIARRPLVRVDIERFEDAMRGLAPRLTLAAGDPAPAIDLPAIDDFHPDQIYRSFEAFAGLRELRRRLLDPSTFAETAALVGQATQPQAAPALAAEDDSGTLSRLLGARPRATPAAAPAAKADIGRLLQEIVAPYVTPAIDAQQKRLVAAVDEAASQHMRALLHHPPLQRLEARWRAVHRLVTTVEPGPDLAVFLLDTSRDELAADLATGPEASGLVRRITGSAPGGEAWSLLVLDESFGASTEDVALLGGLGAIARQGGAALCAAAAPSLVGCRSVAETPDPADWSALEAGDAARWSTLRQSAPAQALGLAFPRWLLRLPYGAKTDPVESFAFDELDAGRAHEAYLWGNPAFAVALLFAAAHREGVQPGDVQEIDDLPAHTYKEDGEAHLQATAEAFLGDRAVSALIGRGLIPVVSLRNRNALRVARLQSIADPSTAL